MGRKFGLLAESVRDVDPVLRAFDRYLAARVQQRFDQGGPGWPPLQAEQTGRRQTAALESLSRRLVGEGRKAAARQGLRLRAMEAAGEDTVKRREQFARTLQRRLATVQELRRHIAGTAEESLSARLLPRVVRAQARAEKVLGRVSQSFRSEIKRGGLVRESVIPWAGVHNEGGTAGHGAKIPARPFLFLEADDVDVLVEMLRERMLLAME